MTTDLHSLMAPYSLDALDLGERVRFEAHLEQCLTCQAELAGFQATAARLGEAVASKPPAGLRERLLAKIATTPQERPVVVLVERSRLRRTLPRLAVAAAFLLGAVGVGGYVVERDRAVDEHDRVETITQVLGSKDAQAVAKTFPTGGNVRMVMSPSKDAAVIFANQLPDPGSGNVYQVWLIGGSGPVDQGTFKRSGDMVMKGITKADRVAVTVEPEGGSKQPTTAPVATIPI